MSDGIRQSSVLGLEGVKWTQVYEASLFTFSELERLSNLVGKPSENHPLHNSGLLSLDPVQDKTPLYSQLLQAYKWSNKVRGLLRVELTEQNPVLLPELQRA